MRTEINRNATGSIFGWDFQINSAIVLFLRNPANITKIRVEGQNEDIEIYTTDSVTFAQCKSIEQPGNYNNVSQKYKAALESLYDADKKVNNCESLIFVTNTDKPFGSDRNAFYGSVFYTYDELPPDSKKKINSYIISKGWTDYSLDKLHVFVIPFLSNDFKTRYQEIRNYVREFLYDLNVNIPCEDELMMVWQQLLLFNATSTPSDITILKEQLLWPLIVILMDNVDYDWLNDDMDESLQEVVNGKYETLISMCDNKIQLCFNVMFAYGQFMFTGLAKDKIKAFIITQWDKFKDDIALSVTDSEEQEMLTKIVLYRILLKHRTIDNIREKLNLK